MKVTKAFNFVVETTISEDSNVLYILRSFNGEPIFTCSEASDLVGEINSILSRARELDSLKNLPEAKQD